MAPKRTRKRCESAAIVQYCRRGVYPTNGRAHNSVVSEVVELGLRTLVQLGKQAQARRLKGKLTWEGDLDAMRIDK